MISKSLPLVSIIIPNYNYAPYLQETIDSVLAQTYKNIEIIVVDDGSKDNSLNILAGFGDKISVIKQPNKGVSAARNAGAARAKGEYIAFLDADDVWLNQKLEKQMELFFSDRDIGFVHCALKLIKANGDVIGENREGLGGYVASDFLLLRRGVVVGAGSTGIVKSRLFVEVGGFDTNLSTAADWDFCYRIATQAKFGFVKEPLVLYRIHNSNMHSNIKAMEHDMLLSFDKAFAQNPAVSFHSCYSNLHLMLAGSHYVSRNYLNTFKHCIKSLWLKPSNILHLALFPMRRLHRRINQ